MKVLSNICFLASCSSCFGLDNVGHCLLDCDSGRKTNNTRKQRNITKNHTTQLQHDWMIELNPNPFGFGVPQWKMEDLPKKFLRLPIWLPPFCSCPSQGDPWCMDAWSAALQVEKKRENMLPLALNVRHTSKCLTARKNIPGQNSCWLYHFRLGNLQIFPSVSSVSKPSTSASFFWRSKASAKDIFCLVFFFLASQESSTFQLFKPNFCKRPWLFKS